VGCTGADGMNREDIIRMAREAGASHDGPLFIPDAFALRFAALVAAAEREACAQVSEDWDSDMADPRDIAAAIRARGEKK
jgi:hypothetical protein